MGQCLVEVDTDCVGGIQSQLFDADSVLRVGSTLAGHLDDLLHTGFLIVVHHTNQTGTTHIGPGNDTTSRLDNIAETLVFLLKGINTLESNLAIDMDFERFGGDRTPAHRDHIVRLERETTVAIELKARLDGEAIGLGNLHCSGRSLGIDHTTSHIDLHRGGILRQTASL